MTLGVIASVSVSADSLAGFASASISTMGGN